LVKLISRSTCQKISHVSCDACREYVIFFCPQDKWITHFLYGFVVLVRNYPVNL
jgi:hypothetical protein